MNKPLENLKQTVLATRHKALKARMVPFSGWLMPVQYSGILEEHLHTRAKAGLFDICHMGEFWLRGPGAAAAVDQLVTCRTDNLAEGQGRYGFLLNEQGGVIDDLIIFKLGAEEFFLVVNAGTREKDREWIVSRIPADAEFEDASDRTAKLDLQGPLSTAVLEGLAPGEDAAALKRFHCRRTRLNGCPVLLSRTGYTGELGYEIFLNPDDCGVVWDKLLGVEGVKPIGLGARDTLRLEKGLSLYGHELDEWHSPLESNLERFVWFDKDFIGRDALLRQKSHGMARILTGFVCEGRRAAREKFEVVVNGQVAGVVTSGAFSPSLSRGIGLCRIPPELAREGQEITLAHGETLISARVKFPPFV